MEGTLGLGGDCFSREPCVARRISRLQAKDAVLTKQGVVIGEYECDSGTRQRRRHISADISTGAEPCLEYSVLAGLAPRALAFHGYRNI